MSWTSVLKQAKVASADPYSFWSRGIISVGATDGARGTSSLAIAVGVPSQGPYLIRQVIDGWQDVKAVYCTSENLWQKKVLFGFWWPDWEIKIMIVL